MQAKPYRGVLPLAFVVAAMATLAPFTIDTYLPSFPDIGLKLGATHAQMQYTLSLYLLASAFATLVYGPLSDGFGRRRVLVLALSIYLLASLGCAFAATIDQLILLRIGQGLSASAGMVIGRAMVRDIYHGAEAQRVMARVMLLFALAPAIAPIIGGWLHDAFGWHSVFLFLALLAGALLLLVSFGCDETLDAEHRQSLHPKAVGRAYLQALQHGTFIRLVLLPGCIFSAFFIYVAGAPSVIYDFLHLGSRDFWILFLPVVAAIMVGSHIAGKLAGRLRPRATVRLGLAVMLTAAVINLLASLFIEPHSLAVVAPITLYALGMAISMPNMSLLALDCFPDRRGMASALQSFVQMSFTALVVGALVPLLVAALPDMALAMLALFSLGAGLWIWLEMSGLQHLPESQ